MGNQSDKSKQKISQDIPLVIEVNPNPRGRKVRIPFVGMLNEDGIHWFNGHGPADKPKGDA